MPPSRRSANCCSVMTGTPRASAFVALEPAPGPATTSEVFFETEPAALPPREVIAS